MSSKVSKPMSIAKRVNLWYSSFFIILTGLLLLGSFILSDYYLTLSAQNQVKETVIDNAEDFAEGDFEIVDDGVYLARYTSSGQLLEGSVPSGLPENFEETRLGEIKLENSRYIYYDHFDSNSQQWFRGSLSLQRTDQLKQDIFLALFLFLPLLLLIILGGGLFMIRKALKPLQTMSATAKSIEDSLDLSQRMTLDKAPDELAQLATSFNHMMERLEISYERQSQFTADVSHELRTPLSVILSESEYLLEQHDTAQPFKQSISTITNQAKHMKKLITSLLDMARMDAIQDLNQESLLLAPLLKDILETYDLLAQTKDKSFSYNLPSTCQLSGNAHLIKRLVDNLLSNSLKFSQKQFSLNIKEEPQGTQLIVSNDGPMIPADQIPKIWDRLYQQEEARTDSGLGLGLSFVKTIADLHQASIQVKSQENLTQFIISFPSSSSLHLDLIN